MPKSSVNPAATGRLTPDERLSELAGILAAGLIRAHLEAREGLGSAGNLSNPVPSGLCKPGGSKATPRR
jgi:hypothetical protein